MRTITTWAGTVWFTEWQWIYWKDAFRAVISETGATMSGRRKVHENLNKGIGDDCLTIRSVVDADGQVYPVDTRI